MKRATVWPLAVCLAVACDDGSPRAGADALEVQGADALLRSGDVLRHTAHSGLRRLEYLGDDGTTVAFRERIATDGQGRFSIEPVDPVGNAAFDWGAFELLQRSSEGFLFRYRDFAVRDAQLFARNYRWSAAGRMQVAGRPCDRWRVERVVGEPVVFELALDSATGIVLASRELDAAGRIAAAMIYESVDLAPALENVVWHKPSNQEQPLERGTDEHAEVQSSVLRPRLLPTGYAAGETALVVDGDGRRWLKQTYLDGVEPLFLLQVLPATVSESGTDAAIDGSAMVAPGGVVVFRIGSALAIQGVVAGHEVSVIGKAPEAELLDLIESALP
jgi:hypothetical protein